MSNIHVSLDVIETDAQLVKLMSVEIANAFNKGVALRLKSIDKRVRSATLDYLKTTGTYQSLINGDLAAHFGISKIGREARIDAIVQAVANRMEVEYKPIKIRAGKFSNGLTIRVLMTDLSEVLNLSQGVVVTEKGEVLDWLRWLLTMGDKIIISEYEVKLISGKGRSGGGVMVADKAGAWRVPPQYSGTIRKNWLTRALKDNSKAYLSIIEKIIQDELQRIT